MKPNMNVCNASALLLCVALATACSHSPSSPEVARLGASTLPAPTHAVTINSGSSYSEALSYSRCMRAHGIGDFPDPDSSGEIDVKGAALRGGPNSDLNGSNPQFTAAQAACQSLLPAESAAQQHHDAAQALEWARCMRSHGVANFPDPDSDGGMHVAAIRAAGVDVTTPQFHAAAAACQTFQPNGIQVPGGAARS